MNIYHNCRDQAKEPISVRLYRSYFGKPALTQKGIKVIIINSEQDTKDKGVLHCEKCKKDISEEEITLLLGYCNYCKQLLPLNKLFVPRDTGGVFCEEHCNEFFPNERKTDLVSIAKKLILRNE
jgi:hypothetical protein